MQPQSQTTDNINLRPGVAMRTGNDLDVTMNEQAVMGVTSTDGTLAFTRRGDLKMTSTGALENGAGLWCAAKRVAPSPFRQVSKSPSTTMAGCMP
jgi:flagellar basal body rod protein FlgF